jgi:hypothetical protein
MKRNQAHYKPGRLIVPILLAGLLTALLPAQASAQSCYGGYCGSGEGDDGDAKQPVEVGVYIVPADAGTVLVNSEIPPDAGTSTLHGDILVDGVRISPTGVFTALQGDTLTLSATPGPGYTFERWSGWFDESAEEVEAPIYNHKTLVAHFVPADRLPLPAATEGRDDTIAIPEGTAATDSRGRALTQVLVELRQPRALPSNGVIIGDVYDLKPDGATFDPPLPLSLPYDESRLPSGVDEAAICIAEYDADTQDWIALPSVVDTDGNTVNAEIGHLSEYAVVAPLPEGAAPLITPGFSFSSLSVAPTQPYAGQDVVTSVIASYSGGNAQAHTRVYAVVDGVIAAETELVLSPGDQVPVRLTFQLPSEGNYVVEINGLSETIQVASAPPAASLTRAVELAEQQQFTPLTLEAPSFFSRWSTALYILGALVLLLLVGPLLNAFRRRLLRYRYDL